MNTTIEIESIRTLIKKGWDVVKANWKKFVHFALVGIGITAIFWAVIFILGFALGFIWGIATGSHTLPVFLTIPISFIQTIASFVLMGVLSFASAKFIATVVNGENITPWQIIKPFVLDYRQVFLTVLLATALLYGGSIIIIPAIFFYYGTLLYIYTAGVEGKRGLSALIQSYWYTNNRKAELFGKLLAISLLFFVSIIAYVVVLGIIFALVVKLNLVVLTTVLGIITGIITLILFFGVVAVMQAVMYSIYLQLKNQAPEVIDSAFYENKKKKFKIFIGIGLVILFIFVASKPLMPEKDSGINDLRMPKISQQPQTYSNEKFAYSLTYPGNFFKKESAAGDSTMFYSLKNKGENIIVVVMEKEEGDEVVKNFITNLKNDTEVSSLVSLGDEKITLGTTPASKTTVTYTEGVDKKETKTSLVSASSDDDWVFILMHSCYIDSCEDAALDTIVSSFKIE